MGRKYDALDWQFFSQKKNIEEIEKNTRIKRDIEITATIELTITIISLILENLYNNQIPEILCYFMIIISIAPFIWIIGKYAMKFYEKRKPGSTIPNIEYTINLFDNDICYYVLMAESYVDKIKNIKTDNPSDVEQFYFIETCFYINKAIYNLSITAACAKELYSTNWEDVYINKRISYTRLKNIFNIIDMSIRITEEKYDTISMIDEQKNYIQQCIKYREKYTIFKSLFKEIDPSIKEVVKKEEDKLRKLKTHYKLY